MDSLCFFPSSQTQSAACRQDVGESLAEGRGITRGHHAKLAPAVPHDTRRQRRRESLKLLVTTSKALVTRSDALVTSSLSQLHCFEKTP